MESESPSVRDKSAPVGVPEASLEELVAYLRQKRSDLRERWASRISSTFDMRAAGYETDQVVRSTPRFVP